MNQKKHCAILVATSAMLLAAATSLAQDARAEKGVLSFAVYGDSRTMLYLPSKVEQKAQAIELMVEMFNLVFPEKVAEEVVGRQGRQADVRPRHR